MTTNEPKQHETWAKLLDSETFGQVLVTKDWDDDEETDVVQLQTRGRTIVTLKFHCSSEEVATKVFDFITVENVDALRRGTVPTALEELTS